MPRRGVRVRRKHGFTLIELLIVMVIIGILVAVLIPRWANSRDRAFQAAMKSDLRNLATAEESYFYDNASYTTSLSALIGFRSSQGVTVTINQASMGGWSATASHPASSRQCYLFVGSASPVGAATAEGQVACQ
jgi:prepilin-type N-terminal cleavage/methylation domain-containing protein